MSAMTILDEEQAPAPPSSSPRVSNNIDADTKQCRTWGASRESEGVEG